MKVIAFTGAGISKSAGIPTFEEIEGIKEKLSVEFREENPFEFRKAMNLLISNVKDKEPTMAHKILAKHNVPIITMNVDNLHKLAGSSTVIEIHGNYLKDNIVLYGEEMHDAEGALNLIINIAKEAEENNEIATLLIIGTSMQTAFAHVLARIAKAKGMNVFFINDNADKKVELFFELID